MNKNNLKFYLVDDEENWRMLHECSVILIDEIPPGPRRQTEASEVMGQWSLESLLSDELYLLEQEALDSY